MQGTDKGENTPRRIKTHFGLIAKAVRQQPRSFIMQASPPHIDRFDLGRRRRPDRIVITLADHEIVFHDPAERDH